MEVDKAFFPLPLLSPLTTVCIYIYFLPYLSLFPLLKWLYSDILSEFTVLVECKIINWKHLGKKRKKKKRYRYCMERFTVDYRTVPSTVFSSLAKWMDRWMNV